MKLIDKLLYRRFSKDEYKQLREILSVESKILLKRPQYIIGNIMMIGLIFYFLVKAFGPESFEWPKTVNVIAVVVGVFAALLVVWLLLLKLFKVKNFWAIYFISFWGFWMLLFGLLTTAQTHSKTKWEYLIYSILILLGWLCCCNSIKEYLCEKIFTSRKKSESPTVN